MAGKIRLEDLPQEVQELLGLGDDSKKPKYTKRTVGPDIVALGNILVALKALTNKQARWCLDTASEHLRRGSRRSANIEPNTKRRAKRGRRDGTS